MHMKKTEFANPHFRSLLKYHFLRASLDS
jgi:hypothetical protein